MYRFLKIHFSFWMIFFLPLRFILKLLIHFPEKINSYAMEGLKDKKIIYILPRNYFINYFVLNMALRKTKRSYVKYEPRRGNIPKNSLMVVTPKPGLMIQESEDLFEEHFLELMEDEDVKKGNVMLMPVSIFWSRTPKRTDRNFILKALFPDDTTAGSLQKLIIGFLHGRRIHVFFGEAISPLKPSSVNLEKEEEGILSLPSLQPHEASPSGKNETVRKLRRQLLILFQRQRAGAVGPSLYNFHSIERVILRSPEGKSFLNSLTGGASKNYKKAVKNLKEVAANYSYTTVRGMEVLLDIIWTKIFTGVRVRNYKNVERQARGKRIVWMPCHRSHLDYLLLGYVTHKKGLPIPHVAGGVNLFFWPIGSLIRRCGCFSIRRSFRGNRTYKFVFNSYLDFLMHNSFAVEYFQEGGRSRIGKMRQPAYGMTQMITESILRRKAGDTSFLPVYFGYERVMEEGPYTRELRGEKKEKENLLAMFKAIPLLKQNFGSVDTVFAKPLKFSDVWERHYDLFCSEFSEEDLLPRNIQEITPEHTEGRSVFVQSFSRYLADQVNKECNSVATVTGTSLLANAVLHSDKDSLSLQTIKHRMKLLISLVECLNEALAWDISVADLNEEGSYHLTRSQEKVAKQEERKESFVRKLRKYDRGEAEPVVESHLPSRNVDSFLDGVLARGKRWEYFDIDLESIILNEEKEMSLWWYRGTVFHIMTIPGFFAAWLLGAPHKWRSLDDLKEQFHILRDFWKNELFWKDGTKTDDMVESLLNLFKNMDLVHQEEEKILPNENKKADLHFLASLVVPEREMYSNLLGVAKYLASEDDTGTFERVKVSKLVEKIQGIGLMRGELRTKPNLIKVNFERVFKAFTDSNVFVPEKLPALVVKTQNIRALNWFFEPSKWRALMG